jgi:multidrug efflux pump subunit AcrA (membrane-fusion protein)
MTSRVAGYVRAIHVRSGDLVKAGQLLVELEANDTRAGVSRQRAELAHAVDSRAEAESAVAAARATAELARINLERDRSLLANGAITRQAFDDAQAQATTAAAQLAAAEARLRAATSGIDIARASLAESQATLDYTRVTAPFAGRVVERRVDPGALASPAMPLLVLDDGANLRVEAAVEESRAAEVKLGDTVTVELGARTLSGTVGEIVPSVDIASRAFLVKIDLEGAGAVAPGTFARLAFASGSRAQLVVPTTAISSLGALDRVFVVDQGRAHIRMIARGETQGPWTEVLAGVTSDELVATAPERLRDGARVEVRR